MIYIITLIVVAIIVTNYIIRNCKEFKELKELRNSCFDGLERALLERYDVMEDLIDWNKDNLECKNRFVIKLLQAKLLPVKEKLKVENELVTDLQILINAACDNEVFRNSQRFVYDRVRLVKSERAIYEAITTINERSDDFNNKINSFPNRIVASIGGFKNLNTYQLNYITI